MLIDPIKIIEANYNQDISLESDCLYLMNYKAVTWIIQQTKLPDLVQRTDRLKWNRVGCKTRQR